ncbi:RNA1 polyprotein, partial [Dissostichus eleginoides]
MVPWIRGISWGPKEQRGNGQAQLQRETTDGPDLFGMSSKVQQWLTGRPGTAAGGLLKRFNVGINVKVVVECPSHTPRLEVPTEEGAPQGLDRPAGVDGEKERKKRGAEDEPEIYDCYSTLRKDTESHAFFNLLQYGSSSQPKGGGEERDNRGCWETDQWPEGLDYCPGAMVTGTNQYYI